MAYHHVERVKRLKAGNHSCDERMTCDFGKDIALVADVFDLFEADYWGGCE